MYKLALKSASEQCGKMRENISGLTQQIHELKLENEKKDETINELFDVVDKLTNGEARRELNRV